MAAESTTSSSITEPVEVPLTQKQKKYLTDGGPTLIKLAAEMLDKGTLSPEEKAYSEKKMNMEKRLISGEYATLREKLEVLPEDLDLVKGQETIFLVLRQLLLQRKGLKKE